MYITCIDAGRHSIVFSPASGIVNDVFSSLMSNLDCVLSRISDQQVMGPVVA